MHEHVAIRMHFSTVALYPAGTVQDPFALSNRVGINGTLHRISAMRDRGGEVYALTYRIGRHPPGRYIMHCLAPSFA